jgi:hypothetical protein
MQPPDSGTHKREAPTAATPESSKRSKNTSKVKFLPARVLRGRNSPVATAPLKVSLLPWQQNT